MAQIASGASADIMTVDPTSKAARVSLYAADGTPLLYTRDTKPTTVAGPLTMGLNDGVVTPTRVDRFGGYGVATHQQMFSESFEGATTHVIRWLSTATTMTSTQSSVAGLTLNSGNTVTATTGILMSTPRRFSKTQRGLMQLKFRARLNRQNNSVMEIGFGDVATFNGTNTVGAYFQVTAAGVIQPVVTYNSVDITGSDISGLINTSNYYTFDILLDDDEVVFVVQDTSTSTVISRQVIALATTAARLFSSSSMPIIARVYNTATPPVAAPTLILTDVYLSLVDANLNRETALIAASNERGFTSNPLAGSQLAQWGNSTEPTSATLSNTAAGYTSLGGKFQFAAVAGAATDFALFGFQVPTPMNLVVTGIDIDTWNTGAAGAATPTLLTWAVGVGSTAVSLATATVMRVGLGSQLLVASIPIGGHADRRISKQFRTPLYCPAGRFFHIILRMPVSTATASQVIAGMVNIEGFFE